MLLIRNKPLRQAFGLLETLNFLAIRLALKNPRRSRLFPGAVFRTYMSLVENEKWRCREIFDIVTVPRGTRIVLEHIPGRGISTALDELAYLALLSRSCEPRTVFEIGTFRGRTALNFALNSPKECTIWTLDLAPAERAPASEAADSADSALIAESDTGVDYRGKDVEAKIRQLFGNSLTFDVSPFVGQIDLVFIDGAHNYATVKSDTANAMRMVKPGGLIIWHDFANYGDYNDVTRAVLRIVPGEKITRVSNSQLAIYQHA